jgi:hypothetical protein
LILIGEYDDETQLIEHFRGCVQESYNTSPVFSVGTFEQTENEALHRESIEDVRLAL